MARKSKDDGEESSMTPPTQVVRKMPAGDYLKRFVKRCNNKASEISGSVGELREEIANAVEKKHVHKGVLALLRKLDKMEPEKLSEYLDHLDFGLDVCGLRERAESAPGLPIDAEAGAGAGDESGSDEEGEEEDEEASAEAEAAKDRSPPPKPARHRRGLSVVGGTAPSGSDVG